jgi:DNA-binding NtrC family response regulator
MRSRVLFVTGHSEDARQLSHMLQSLPVAIDHAGSLQQARAQLQRQHYDVVLTEAALPDGNWLDTLHLARECPTCLEVLVTDPQADAQLWAEALNLGAYDLIAQPFAQPEVQRILYNACTRTAYSARGSAAH